MARKRRSIKRGKIFIVIILIALIVFLFLYFGKKEKSVPEVQVEVIDSIDNFQYELNDNETEYYTGLFNQLKELLSSEDYDMYEYATLIGKLFLADFYDLDSKVMKSDVGGTQFVYSEYRSDFEAGAMDSVYKSVESNVYGDRKQVLPTVVNVEKVSIERKLFEYNGDIDYDAYHVEFRISYKEDLGYPSNVLIVLIHNGDKLEIAKMGTL